MNQAKDARANGQQVLVVRMNKVVEEGEYEIQIGTASDDIRLRRTIFVVENT